jgi:hypothetical protein
MVLPPICREIFYRETSEKFYNNFIFLKLYHPLKCLRNYTSEKYFVLFIRIVRTREVKDLLRPSSKNISTKRQIFFFKYLQIIEII